jgi:hypothetical protein
LAEVTGLPEMFAGVSGNFISAAVKGTLVMVEESVDLVALQTVAAETGADILPVGWEVRKVAWAVTKHWWSSFGYDYVLAAIRAKFHEVIVRVQLVLL